MTWITAQPPQHRTVFRKLRVKPRLLPTAPIQPDFNLSFEAEDDEVESNAEQCDIANSDAPLLREELEAWDAASDEAFDNLEGSHVE